MTLRGRGVCDRSSDTERGSGVCDRSRHISQCHSAPQGGDRQPGLCRVGTALLWLQAAAVS